MFRFTDALRFTSPMGANYAHRVERNFRIRSVAARSIHTEETIPGVVVTLEHNHNGTFGGSPIMTKPKESSGPQQGEESPRAWQSGEEFEQEAQLFLNAAQRFIGRGESANSWCDSQRLRLRLAYLIEFADYSDSWQKTMQHMLRLAEGAAGAERRRLALQAIHSWGGSWKLAQWQGSSETRRTCLGHLATALQAFDGAFSQLRCDLDNLAIKLDAYTACPQSAHEKSAERILAELIVEGADALGFTVEPHEPMQAEVLRIVRQLERDCIALPAYSAQGRSSRVMQKAQSTSLRARRVVPG